MQSPSRNPRRSQPGCGQYKQPRTSFVPGAVSRREWLRFLSHVVLGTDCQCTSGMPHRHWLWSGSKHMLGYGEFQWRGRKYKAHRFACIALGCNIAEGQEPDHLCKKRDCVNPACLEPVTHRENILRGTSPSALQAQRGGYCVQGHLLANDNLVQTMLRKSGTRRCRLCDNAYQRAYRKRRAMRAME